MRTFPLRPDKATPDRLVSTLTLYTGVLVAGYLMPPPPHTHIFLCFLLATSRCRMAPGTGPQGREVAACPAEMLRVSDKHPSGMPHSAVGHELHRHEATTRIFKRCLRTETPVKRGYPLIA